MGISLSENKEHALTSFLVAAAAVLISISASMLVYIQYFQTYGLSLKRGLFFGGVVVFLSLFAFVLIQYLTKKYYLSKYADSLKSLGFWILISLILSPCFYPIPHYPLSPLFQASSHLKIIIHLPESNNEIVQLKGVWLRFGDKVYSSNDFQFSNAWNLEAGHYTLNVNLDEGDLSWKGKIGERATLIIFPMDVKTQVTVLWDGEKNTSVLIDKPFVVNKKNNTPIWYYNLIVFTRIICLGYVLFIFFSWFKSLNNARKSATVVIALLIVSSIYTVYVQFENPEIKGRLDIQIGRHEAVIAGTALNPWEYRVFAEWLIEGVVWFAKQLGFKDVYFVVFALLRIVQNISIFVLAHLYYRKLGFSNLVSLVGSLFIIGAMLNSFHQSDLSFNTYFDVIFYLSAILLILNNLFGWLPLLIIVASLNRETSGVIPFLALFALPTIKGDKSKIVPVLFSFGIWIFIFFSLRRIYPDNELFIPYGYYPGLPLLKYNLSTSFALLLRFMSFAPLIGLLMFRYWADALRRFFVVLIPIWFLVHFFVSVVSEARLFLVPQLLVFIPTFLYFAQKAEPIGRSTNVTI